MIRRNMVLILAAASLLPSPLAAQGADLIIPRFSEETETSGLATSYQGEWEYMVGGGVTVLDCNADGREDLFLSGGSAASAIYRNDGTTGGPLRFAAVESGLEIAGITGAYPLDIDSDGLTDLAVLRVGANRLMRGLGDCRFEDAGSAWGFDGGDAWSTAFAATWEKGSSWPTLAIGNYIDRRQDDFPWGSCTDNWLHRPAASGTGFAPPVPLTPSFCALSMLFTDWDRSGQPSLRVSNDREYYKGGQEQLWHLPPDAAPRLFTAQEGWKPLRIWGMGIASRDVTGDGYPDYFLTSMADNKLQTLAEPPKEGAAKPGFADVAFARGVIAQRPYTGGDARPSTAWHAQFDDVNNDGRADLFVAKGNVDAMPDFAQNDPNNLLLQRSDGTFLEAGELAGVASMLTGRGGALADFNLDGLLDLVVVNRRAPAQIWRNNGPSDGHWLQVRLRQAAPNPDAIGAWIEIRQGERIDRREITAGGGHMSGQSGWWHFGLGNVAIPLEVRVIWPDGNAGPWQQVAPDGFYTLAPDVPPEAWQPPQN